MEKKAWLRGLVAMTLLLPVVAACSADEETEANIEVETAPPAPTPITVQVMPQGGAMVAGDLTAMHEADNTRVSLTLSGLTEGKDYEARIRYGTCAVAMNYVDDEPFANDATPGDSGSVMDDHEIGEVVEQIDLDRTGATASGTGEFDNDDLAAMESAFVSITEDSDEDVLVGCADLSGHGGMGGTMGGGMGGMPVDSAHP